MQAPGSLSWAWSAPTSPRQSPVSRQRVGACSSLLKWAVGVYFGVWCGYPTLWVRLTLHARRTWTLGPLRRVHRARAPNGARVHGEAYALLRTCERAQTCTWQVRCIRLSETVPTI